MNNMHIISIMWPIITNGRAWRLVAPPDFKSGMVSDEEAGWVRFPHPPATPLPMRCHIPL